MVSCVIRLVVLVSACLIAFATSACTDLLGADFDEPALGHTLSVTRPDHPLDATLTGSGDVSPKTIASLADNAAARCFVAAWS